MELIDRLDAARDRWNVLRHPFYLRWSEGELERDELALYAGQYRHAVGALAEASAAAAVAGEPNPELDRHAAEEMAHVALWDDFSRALGVDGGPTPLEATSGCANAWTAGRDRLECLAILYTVESGQPAISRTKLDGLVEHYGMKRDGPETAYFRLHSELDREHAAQARRLLEELAEDADHERLVELAEAAVEANWRLLDGVESAYAGR